MRTDRLERSFLDARIVDMNGWPYFVTPLSDGCPRMDAGLLEEAVDGIIEVSDLDCDVLLAPEAMGIPLATALTLRTGIPFIVMRKRSYGMDGEIAIKKNTGYGETSLFVNTLERGERVAIVDDVIDTGGTIRAIVIALRAAGIIVTEVITVYNRNEDVEALAEDLGVPIRWLVAVGTEGDVPLIRDTE